jgi:hypothetical protein
MMYQSTRHNTFLEIGFSPVLGYTMGVKASQAIIIQESRGLVEGGWEEYTERHGYCSIKEWTLLLSELETIHASTQYIPTVGH